MRLLMHVMAGAVVLLGAGGALAAEQPLREAESENARFYLRIRPGRPGLDAARGCKATLFERSGEHHRARIRWDRFLVNDVAPVRGFVRNDGRFVVTVDDFRRGGAGHAVVIYGEHGELLRHFLLTDLLVEDDWKHVKVQKDAINWLTGAKSQFTDGPPEFVITLGHGRSIRIDLTTLTIVPDEVDVAEVEALPAEIVAALFGGLAAEEPTDVAEQPPSTLDEGEEIVQEDEEARPESPAEEVADAAEAEQPTEDVAEPSSVEREVAAADGVPQPDPAAPFDYLEWMNELTATTGPSAAADFEAAAAMLVGWDSKPEIQRAAVQGDPEALAAPETAEWLDANREALAYFRDATTLEFNGWELKSEDGSLLNVRLPALAPLRELGRVAVVEGRSLAAEGRLADAAGSYLDVLAAGSQISRGATVIEDLVGMGIQRPAADALLDLQAEDVDWQIDYTDLVDQTASAFQPSRSMGDAIQLERAFYLDSVQRIYDYDPSTGDYRLNGERAAEYFSMAEPDHGPEAYDQEELLQRQGEFGFDETVRAGNDYYDAMEEAFALPYAESVKRLAAIHAEAGKQNNPFVSMLAPDFSRAHFHQTRCETTRRASLLVANLRAYRQQYGSYPESLEALGNAEYTTDAFTRQPFRYRVNGDDFVLYSVGSNGSDDGGVHDADGESNDLVFWPRPE